MRRRDSSPFVRRRLMLVRLRVSRVRMRYLILRVFLWCRRLVRLSFGLIRCLSLVLVLMMCVGCRLRRVVFRR